MKTNKFLLTVLTCILLFSCKDDIDDVIRPATSLELSDFVYRGLNYWSLYKADVPDLADDRFVTDKERFDFLDQFQSPEEAFEALTSSRDRFSILRDDYIVFENALAGIRRSTGMRFTITQDPNNVNNRIGVVRFVVNNSPASQAGVTRGMIFTGVDGTPLTAASDTGEIFSRNQFSIDLAEFNGTELEATGQSITLDNIELSINPVHTVRTFDVDGTSVGYLHYTGFTNEFDSDLNAAFGTFQSTGITELILDLRYNGGGSIETANDLCTMITGQFQGDTFITQQYNAQRNPENEFVRRFNNTLGSGDEGAQINSLNLNRIIVLTTGNTASASELILSGLDPYIDIVQIGTNTVGKFEGSFLLYDAPAPNFSRAQANINHRYVMLPLVLKSINANGLTDYFDGFTPDIFLEEDIFNLGVLGEESDPYTAAAIDVIRGRRNISRSSQFPIYSIYESDQNDPLYQRMMVE